ncbi:MAG: DUF4144 domain-containing protein [Gammaproteobacteria bacterium]|nr:DUF4144 domain-containing protein [Gammaproteobacteria bacterium]MBU2059953.1 DUF4144 domain-containing protein [Gammaproteobacteria bacterium]MBU2175792.1 DUF4144 domain-containing protein [Gammaproteobacteria bacterium]MBU2247615.1 DUF4144 domain-containing protein [Gammaproteobacteria bacterium]MBU2342930.1 DUF4144 domain-containing protein [Gammaproteobacteria bacterium]
MMIQYPAIFKFAGQDELIYLAAPGSFGQQYQLQQPYLTPEDLLIDATGQAYLLDQLNLDSDALPSLFQQFELSELTALVQAHFFALAQSCVVKIQAPSIPALFSLLVDADET